MLKGFDLDIATARLIVILGRSGGGKSVLLKHIIGLMRPDAGDVLVDGESIVQSHRAPARRRAQKNRHPLPERRACSIP